MDHNTVTAYLVGWELRPLYLKVDL